MSSLMLRGMRLEPPGGFEPCTARCRNGMIQMIKDHMSTPVEPKRSESDETIVSTPPKPQASWSTFL